MRVDNGLKMQALSLANNPIVNCTLLIANNPIVNCTLLIVNLHHAFKSASPNLGDR